MYRITPKRSKQQTDAIKTAILLRKQGLTLREISKVVDMSYEGVRQAIKRYPPSEKESMNTAP